MAKCIFYFAAVGFLAGYLIYRDPSDLGRTVAVGAIAPDFALKNKESREVKLSDYRGKLVLLNFWATDCAPCIREIPSMHALSQRFSNRPFQLLTVSIDTGWKPVANFYKELGIELPTLLDPGRQVFRRFRLTGTPETFIIDANGVIRSHRIGEYKWDDWRLIAQLEEFLPEPSKLSQSALP